MFILLNLKPNQMPKTTQEVSKARMNWHQLLLSEYRHLPWLSLDVYCSSQSLGIFLALRLLCFCSVHLRHFVCLVCKNRYLYIYLYNILAEQKSFVQKVWIGEGMSCDLGLWHRDDGVS